MKTQLPEKSQKIKPVISELSRLISQHYGNHLKYLILYGSYARGDFHSESDIDILVVLDEIKSEMQEISTLADLKTDLLLQYDWYLSTNPVSIQKFENSDFTFYKNVRKEGIRL